MVVFPNCKINLGLQILHKRADDFHDIETVFYPLQFTDALEVISNKETGPAVIFTGTGLVIDGKAEDNLCIKAYHLLKKDFPQLPAVKIHLHKVIPMGAGLGGGSADGAFMLKLLNDQFRLSIPGSKLKNYALQLGSDCPFFILNKPSLATGRGEELEEISLDLSAYKIVLVNPGIHINTRWAFSQISPTLQKKSLKEMIQQPVENWKTELYNDFEPPVFSAHPQLKEIKEELYHRGALYAAMSGSGSTVYGIFPQDPLGNSVFSDIPFLKNNYSIKIIN